MAHIYLIILSLFCYAKVIHGVDMEVEANIRIDPLFMERMKDSIAKEEKLMSLNQIPKIDMPYFKSNSILEKVFRTLVPVNFWKGFNNEEETMRLENYPKRLKAKGVTSIENVGNYLRIKFNLPVEDSLIKEVVDQYESKLNSYSNFLLKKKKYDELHRDYIVLDMVNIAGSLTSSLQKSLMNEGLGKTNNVSKEDKQIMTESLYQFNAYNMEQEMKFICQNMDVCRPWPAYSDYFAKLLSEILKLQHVKFRYIMIKVAQLLHGKRFFFQTILRDEILEWFRVKIDTMPKANMDEMREAISVLRATITHRHRMIMLNDDAVKNKTISTRILIDIVDKAFDTVAEDQIYIQFDTTVTALRAWDDNTRLDIDSVLTNFINYAVATLKFELNALARMEFRTLSDVIFYGKAVDNEQVVKYLLSKGSRYVKTLERVSNML